MSHIGILAIKKMSTNTTLDILRNLRTLVGETAFNEAVLVLNANPSGEPAPKKERKQNKVDPENSAKRREGMGAIQNFIKAVRLEQPVDTPYKEIQKLAGERWKTMNADERSKYFNTPTDDSVNVTTDNEVTPVTTDKEVVVKVVKTVGRPKKSAD